MGEREQSIISYITSSPYFPVDKVDLTTLRFRKELTGSGRCLCMVTFAGSGGSIYNFYFILVKTENHNWEVTGAFGHKENGWIHPQWRYSQPHISLDGCFQADYFIAGGLVTDNGFAITKVRFIWNDKLILEDQVEDSIVLFLTDQKVVLRPDKVELCTASGEIIKSESWHGGFSY